jgi:hypothetical protein
MKYSYDPVLFASWALRLGLAFVFVYAALDALREPAAWSAYDPQFLTVHVPATMLLDGTSIGQIGLAMALLWRKTAPYAAGLALIGLLVIGLTNLGALLIVFRDFGLAFMALGLTFLDWPQRLRAD